MSPDRRTRRKRSTPPTVRTGPSADDEHEIVFFRRHRADGPGRHHYRLFCLLDYEAAGQEKPLLVIVDGRDKPFRTTLTSKDYAEVRALGEEYLARNPRSLV